VIRWGALRLSVFPETKDFGNAWSYLFWQSCLGFTRLNRWYVNESRRMASPQPYKTIGWTPIHLRFWLRAERAYAF
jgi:hypothetical protein